MNKRKKFLQHKHTFFIFFLVFLFLSCLLS